MPSTRATVTCPDCGLAETFTKLQAAREHIDAHRQETGHDPDWELEALSRGVVRAGAEAGVCGRRDR
jgi:hypothetical protein